MLPLRENTWVIGNLVTVTITATVTLGNIVSVIATTVTETTAGVTGNATATRTGGITGTGAIAEARLAGTRLIIVVAEATLVALQEAGAQAATVNLKEAHRTAPGRTAVGRRYPFV
jgi:hypothetical protein